MAQAVEDEAVRRKAIAVAHWHLEALARRAEVIRAFREIKDISRALEGFWIVLESCLAYLEGRTLTQKDLVARATGTVSPATISRTIQDIVDEGWIATEPAADARVQRLVPTEQAIQYYMSRVEEAWSVFYEIGQQATRLDNRKL